MINKVDRNIVYIRRYRGVILASISRKSQKNSKQKSSNDIQQTRHLLRSINARITKLEKNKEQQGKSRRRFIE